MVAAPPTALYNADHDHPGAPSGQFVTRMTGWLNRSGK
jgi:hypothetical protein